MLRRILAMLFCVLCTSSLTIQSASAQSQTVIVYDHLTSLVGYTTPGDQDGSRRVGLRAKGDRIPVAEGGQVCFRVLHANPLLYTYASSSKSIQNTQPSGLADIIAGLGPLTKGILTASNGVLPQGAKQRTIDNLTRYSDDVRQLLLQQANLAKLKLDSDGHARFDSTVAVARQFVSVARQADAQATKDLKDAQQEATGDAGQTAIVEQLHALHQATLTGVEASMAEFEAAEGHLNDLLCTDVKDSDLHVTFGVTSKLPKGTTPKRAVGDELVGVDIEPQSIAAFEIGPMVMLSLTLPRRTFAIDNGVVVEGARDESVPRRVGMLALGRLWPMSWLWSAVGIAKGKDADPDVFLGFVARSGWAVTGIHVGVGAGLILSSVPTGLGQGAKLGAPLPAKIDKLEQVITSEYRAGVGVTFSLTGLQLKKDTK